MSLRSKHLLIEIHNLLGRKQQIQVFQRFRCKKAFRKVLDHSITMYIRIHPISKLCFAMCFNGLVKQPAPLPTQIATIFKSTY